jgi:hypothetical protein
VVRNRGPRHVGGPARLPDLALLYRLSG